MYQKHPGEWSTETRMTYYHPPEWLVFDRLIVHLVKVNDIAINESKDMISFQYENNQTVAINYSEERWKAIQEQLAGPNPQNG